jgi:hypothetical protein
MRYSCSCEVGYSGSNCQIAAYTGSAPYCEPGALVPSRCSIDCAKVTTPFSAECAAPLRKLDPALQETIAAFDREQCQQISPEQFLDRIDALQDDLGCELSLAWQTVRARLRCLSVLSVSHQKLVLHDACVWARRGEGA